MRVHKILLIKKKIFI